MGNLRLAIASLAGVLVLLSIPPIRRRLPVLRSCPPAVEVLLWMVFVSLGLLALAGVRTNRLTELSQAAAGAALAVTGQALGSFLGPTASWVSAHEPGVAILTVAVAGLAWVVVAARAVTIVRRALQPRPLLEDWWVVKPGLGAAPHLKLQPAPSASSASFMDAQAAAQYLGVSRATVYRWARAGRLRSRRAGARLHFSSGDLADLRATDSPQEQRA